MSHRYTISVIRPNIPKPEPFNYKVVDDSLAEIEAIINNAITRNFRKVQSAKIEIMLLNGICPKCKGNLFPSEDGATCFSCGLIVYKDVRDGAYHH